MSRGPLALAVWHGVVWRGEGFSRRTAVGTSPSMTNWLEQTLSRVCLTCRQVTSRCCSRRRNQPDEETGMQLPPQRSQLLSIRNVHPDFPCASLLSSLSDLLSNGCLHCLRCER
jgi:hypothetical protein